jgi:hypothetical protein
MSSSLLAVYRRARVGVGKWLFRKSSKYHWRGRYKQMRKMHPEYMRPCDGRVIKEHLALWRQIDRNVNLTTLFVCCNISGRQDPRIVPEEIFRSDIEPCFIRQRGADFQGYKNIYDKWYGRGLFAESLFHNMEGVICDGNYEKLKESQIETLLNSFNYPVVFKPSIQSGGGVGVCFPRSKEELQAQMKGRSNYVVQRKMRQHAFLDQFGLTAGLNTFRVCTYKSVADNTSHILNVAVRVGRGGGLDNETAGGLVCYVGDGGKLNHYAVDGLGGKFESHPDTGVKFGADNQIVPNFEEMKRLAIQLTELTYYHRLLSLDLCVDPDGRWFATEVNLQSQTVRFSQYAGYPFFGRFTDEIIEYYKANASSF